MTFTSYSLDPEVHTFIKALVLAAGGRIEVTAEDMLFVRALGLEINRREDKSSTVYSVGATGREIRGLPGTVGFPVKRSARDDGTEGG